MKKLFLFKMTNFRVLETLWS